MRKSVIVQIYSIIQCKEPHNLASIKVALSTHKETVKTTSDAGDNVMATGERRTIKFFNCGNLGRKSFEGRQPQ